MPRCALGRGVVRLAEVHDVDAVRAERGADRRRGRRRAGLDLDLHDRCDASSSPCSSLASSRLRAYSLATSPNSSSTGVSRPKMFTSTLSFERSTSISLIDAVEVGERAGDDPHLLAHLVLEPRAAPSSRPRALVLLAGAEDVLDLLARERRGLGAAADEAGDAGRVAHDVPGVVVEAHAHEQVAGEDLLLHDDLAAVLELDDVFHRDDDLEDALLDVHRAHAAREVLLHLVLVAGVGVHDVPAPGPVVRARLGGRRRSSSLVVVVDHVEQLGVGEVDRAGRSTTSTISTISAPSSPLAPSTAGCRSRLELVGSRRRRTEPVGAARRLGRRCRRRRASEGFQSVVESSMAVSRRGRGRTSTIRSRSRRSAPSSR